MQVSSMSSFECYEVSCFIIAATKCCTDREHLKEIEEAIALLVKVHKDI